MTRKLSTMVLVGTHVGALVAASDALAATQAPMSPANRVVAVTANVTRSNGHVAPVHVGDEGDPSHTRIADRVVLASALDRSQDARSGSHVRTEDAKLATVIRDGLQQSTTFRDLVNGIDQTSGFVYIVSSRCVTRGWEPRACLDHRIRVSGGFRFLRVNVHPSESGATLLALIAHELQHALEVLSDETITTLEDVERLYQRIGTNRGNGIFETTAALRIEGIVVREARALGAR